MNNDLISRSALKEDFKSRLARCNEWIEKAKDKETKIRADATKHFICEVIMTIDNAPTIETSYDLYREETCDRKSHCYDYKYWHCIGCHGCKADVRGGKQ